MSQNISGIGQAKVLSQLDTYNHTALLNSPYVVNCQVLEQPPSGIIVEIKQNGSSKLLTSTPAASQQSIDARITLSCAASDVISVIISSPNAQDGFRNEFKAILSITPGLVG